MDANFSCLTHLKATLGGRTGGQSAARHSGGGDGVGVGEGVYGDSWFVVKPHKENRFPFSVPNPLS